MSKVKLNVKDGFPGVVITHDWVRMPDGCMYCSFRGTVRCLSAEEAVGWIPTGHNSANWLARIEGSRSSVNLMGCQVRAVLEGDVPGANSDTYVVP